MVLLASLKELLGHSSLLNILVQTALVANSCIEGRRLLQIFNLFGDFIDRLLHVSLMHMLFKVVFELLALWREDFLSLGCLDRDLWGELKVLAIASHLSFDISSHAFLNHESVHVNVRLETATICRISETIIFKVLFDLEVFFLLYKHLFVALNGASFQIELIFYGVYP